MKKLLILLTFILIIGCSQKIQKTEQTKDLMGTFITITTYNENVTKSEQAINLAFKEIERTDDILSHKKNTTQVFLLNKQGYIDNASSELIYNLKQSLYYSNLSNGAFDITVKPILDLYSKSFKELGRPPNDNRIKQTLLYVNYSKIIMNSKTKIIVLRDEMQITLGGIAKGYAIDKAINILEKQGIKHALVNAGGDMRAIGNKTNEDWKIALENPRNKEEYITIININNNSVCTSGDYERYFDEDKKFHHIIDPKTGYSALDLISVTIITDKAMDCDALATSVFVLGREKGLKLIESLENVEGLIITKEKDIVKSSGFSY